MPFTAWKCDDCKSQGKVRHDKTEARSNVIRWASEQHQRKSPGCVQAFVNQQAAVKARVAAMSPRDQQLVVCARLRRKVLADAFRNMRGSHPGPLADTALGYAAWTESVRKQHTETRQRWLSMKAGVKGHAFT